MAVVGSDDERRLAEVIGCLDVSPAVCTTTTSSSHVGWCWVVVLVVVVVDDDIKKVHECVSIVDRSCQGYYYVGRVGGWQYRSRRWCMHARALTC